MPGWEILQLLKPCKRCPTVQTDCKLMGPSMVAVLNLHMLERRALVLYFPYSTSLNPAPNVVCDSIWCDIPTDAPAPRDGYQPWVCISIIPQILESGHWTIAVPMLCLDNNNILRFWIAILNLRCYFSSSARLL